MIFFFLKIHIMWEYANRSKSALWFDLCCMHCNVLTLKDLNPVSQSQNVCRSLSVRLKWKIFQNKKHSAYVWPDDTKAKSKTPQGFSHGWVKIISWCHSFFFGTQKPSNWERKPQLCELGSSLKWHNGNSA